VLKKLVNLIYTLAIAVVVLIAVATVFTVTQAPGGLRLFVVQSGSMEPSLPTGSVVLVAPQSEYKVNDAITFFADLSKTNLKSPNATVTHRIVKINNDEGRLNFQTKGDANNSPDKDTTPSSAVLGKVIFSLPYFGRAIAFAKTQTGFLVLIVVPGTIIIYSELVNIKNELVKILRRRHEKVTG